MPSLVRVMTTNFIGSILYDDKILLMSYMMSLYLSRKPADENGMNSQITILVFHFRPKHDLDRA